MPRQARVGTYTGLVETPSRIASRPIRPIGAIGGFVVMALLGCDAARAFGGPAANAGAMVREQLEPRGIDDPRVLAAMGKVPRHEFVPAASRARAYADEALSIGHGVTISQPYIVALMSQLAEVEPGDKVLDVGTGSGYQAAVLARMGAKVWSIEIIEPLAKEGSERLRRLGFDEVRVKAGDGYRGWPGQAPFDAIILAAAAPAVPEPLRRQLAVGGRLVLPVGDGYDQTLRVITRTERGFESRDVLPVLFVPMTGEVRSR